MLVTGLQRAFKWDLVEGTVERLYACRKRACGPTSDVLDGLCSTDAYSTASEGDDQTWIVAPIVSAIVVTGALLVYMWYDKQASNLTAALPPEARPAVPLPALPHPEIGCRASRESGSQPTTLCRD